MRNRRDTSIRIYTLLFIMKFEEKIKFISFKHEQYLTMKFKIYINNLIFIPFACTERNNSLPFSGASSTPLYPFLPPTSLQSSLTSPCHLFLGLPLSLVFFQIIYNTSLGILFTSILCTCPNQRNLFKLIVSVIVGFLISA